MDKPVSGKVYALTGLGPSIANGNTWAESEVRDENDHAPSCVDRSHGNGLCNGMAKEGGDG